MCPVYSVSRGFAAMSDKQQLLMHKGGSDADLSYTLIDLDRCFILQENAFTRDTFQDVPYASCGRTSGSCVLPSIYCTGTVPKFFPWSRDSG